MLKLRVMVRWLLLLVIYSASLATSPLYAVDATWVGGTNFLWHIPSNWSGNAAPNSSDFNVFIDSNAGVNSSVTLQSSVGPITIGNLTIDAGDGLLIGAPLTTSGIAGAGSIAIFDTTLTLGHGVFSGVLLSNGNVTLNQPGETIFLGTYFSGSSANTYTGLTTIENDAVLHLDKSNNTNAISGDVLITSGGELTYFSLTAVLKHENIIDTAKVTIADGKWWNFTGSNVGYVETITDLEFTGAGATGGEVSGDGLNFELKILGSISHTGEGLNEGLIRGVLLNLNGGNRTIHTASDAVLRIDSRLFNGGVNKTGDGTVALRGINDYAGGTTLNGGTLSLLNSSALGTGLVTFQAGTIDYRYYNSGSPSSINIANPITLEANATLYVGNVVDLFGPHTPTQSGVISETGGPRGVTKTGPGDLILSAVNSFTGTAHINEGALVLGNPNALKSATVSININDGLDLNGQLIPRIGALGGTGNLDLGSLSLNIGSNAASTTYAGRLSGTSASALVHNGPGPLTLTEASTYTGDTIVEEGVLSLAKVFLSDSASLVLDSNATLNLTHGMTDTVDEFYLGGIARGAGTHGAVGSGADFEYAQITGTGMLRVLPIPALAGDYNNDGIVGIADYTAWRDNLVRRRAHLQTTSTAGKLASRSTPLGRPALVMC